MKRKSNRKKEVISPAEWDDAELFLSVSHVLILASFVSATLILDCKVRMIIRWYKLTLHKLIPFFPDLPYIGSVIGEGISGNNF